MPVQTRSRASVQNVPPPSSQNVGAAATDNLTTPHVVLPVKETVAAQTEGPASATKIDTTGTPAGNKTAYATESPVIKDSRKANVDVNRPSASVAERKKGAKETREIRALPKRAAKTKAANNIINKDTNKSVKGKAVSISKGPAQPPLQKTANPRKPVKIAGGNKPHATQTIERVRQDATVKAFEAKGSTPAASATIFKSKKQEQNEVDEFDMLKSRSPGRFTGWNDLDDGAVLMIRAMELRSSEKEAATIKSRTINAEALAIWTSIVR